MRLKESFRITHVRCAYNINTVIDMFTQTGLLSVPHCSAACLFGLDVIGSIACSGHYGGNGGLSCLQIDRPIWPFQSAFLPASEPITERKLPFTENGRRPGRKI